MLDVLASSDYICIFTGDSGRAHPCGRCRHPSILHSHRLRHTDPSRGSTHQVQFRWADWHRQRGKGGKWKLTQKTAICVFILRSLCFISLLCFSWWWGDMGRGGGGGGCSLRILMFFLCVCVCCTFKQCTLMFVLSFDLLFGYTLFQLETYTQLSPWSDLRGWLGIKN